MDVVEDGFRTFLVDTGEANMFEALHQSVEWEVMGKGRQGAVIVRVEKERDGTVVVPIVRTTTSYTRAAQAFVSLHERLIGSIASAVGVPLDFNNAAMEIYDASYRKMGWHTDCSLDLRNESFICLFSVYEEPVATSATRTLCVMNKRTQQVTNSILHHNSAIFFSTSTNAAHVHKIVALSPPRVGESRWLGVTFRFSKTKVRFAEGVPRLLSGPALTLATPEQRGRFLNCKGAENKTDGVYEWGDDFNFTTISASDLMEPA